MVIFVINSHLEFSVICFADRKIHFLLWRIYHSLGRFSNCFPCLGTYYFTLPLRPFFMLEIGSFCVILSTCLSALQTFQFRFPPPTEKPTPWILVIGILWLETKFDFRHLRKRRPFYGHFNRVLEHETPFDFPLPTSLAFGALF